MITDKICEWRAEKTATGATDLLPPETIVRLKLVAFQD